jgi:hypothetical protein
MSDPLPGVANILTATIVAIADGSRIVPPSVVNFYVIALAGTNAGKWFKGSNQTWSATEEIAAAGSHIGRGHWTAVIPAIAWVQGTVYEQYAEEAGGLSIATPASVRRMPEPRFVAGRGIALTAMITGVNLYARGRRPADGYCWNIDTSTWEAMNIAYPAKYAIGATETPAGSYRYALTVPAWEGPADYELEWYERTPENVALKTDTLLAVTRFAWDGESVIVEATAVGAIQVAAEAALAMLQDYDYGLMPIRSDTIQIAAAVAAIAIQTARIGSSAVTWQSPVTPTGKIVLTRGDTYIGARSLPFTKTNWVGPDLDGAPAVFRVTPLADWQAGTGVAAFEAACTLAQSGTTVTTTVELTAAQTEALGSDPAAANWHYAIVVDALGDPPQTLTVFEGPAHVEQRIGPAT